MLNLDALTAIDVHVHVEQDDHGNLSTDEQIRQAAQAYFKGGPLPAPPSPTSLSSTGRGRWLP